MSWLCLKDCTLWKSGTYWNSLWGTISPGRDLRVEQGKEQPAEQQQEQPVVNWPKLLFPISLHRWGEEVEMKRRDGEKVVLRSYFPSHYPVMILLVKIQLISPMKDCFPYDGIWWVISSGKKETHKYFVIFSLRCPDVEGSDRENLLDAWLTEKVNSLQKNKIKTFLWLLKNITIIPQFQIFSHSYYTTIKSTVTSYCKLIQRKVWGKQPIPSIMKT